MINCQLCTSRSPRKCETASAPRGPPSSSKICSPVPAQHGLRYSVQPLMHAAVVVPAEEFREYMPKMPLMPDQHAVETLPAKRPYQPRAVRGRVGCAQRNRYPPDVHLLPEPHIVCRSTRHLLACVLNLYWTPEPAKLPFTPSNHSLWFHKDQLRFPISPDLAAQRPERPVPVSQHRLLRLALVNGQLLS